MPKTNDHLREVLIIALFLTMLMALFIFFIIYQAQKKQIEYLKRISEIEANFEKILLKSHLEIQEQTFQHISKEIHDNITLSLTLAKLHLHTFDWTDIKRASENIGNCIDLITSSISQLSNISKGLNADIIIQQGLLHALEKEVERIERASMFKIHHNIEGQPVYFSSQNELIIFRIIQEAFNNILKHSKASHVNLSLSYKDSFLTISIHDNGIGFEKNEVNNADRAGFRNMETRTKILKGTMTIDSIPGLGTTLTFKIPFEQS